VASDSREALPKPRAPLSGPALCVAVGVAVLGAAAFGYLQYSSKTTTGDIPLTPQAKAYTRNLQLSDVEIKATESYLKQTVVEIQGKIGNVGDRTLDTVELYCIFYNSYGQVVLRTRVPIVSERMGGLKPGETKTFRLPFDDLPESWNQAMPQLVIAGVKFS